MVAQFLLVAEIASWEVIAAKIIAILVTSAVAYALHYSKQAVKDNEKALLGLSLLDVRVKEILDELEVSLQEKLADGKLTKEELRQLKAEAVSLARSKAKALGIDAIQEFAPKLFPSLIDTIMEGILNKASKKLIKL